MLHDLGRVIGLIISALAQARKGPCAHILQHSLIDRRSVGQIWLVRFRKSATDIGSGAIKLQQRKVALSSLWRAEEAPLHRQKQA